MQITDTIADLLTRIRNANSAKHATVDVPASNVKKAITQILVDEGYVKGFQVIEDGKQGIIRITLGSTATTSHPSSPACVGSLNRVCVFILAVKICPRFVRVWVSPSFPLLRES